MKLVKLSIPIDVETFVMVQDDIPNKDIKDLITTDIVIVHSICKSIEINQIKSIIIPNALCNGYFKVSDTINFVEIQ